LAKQITESCLTCRKVNKQALRVQLPGGRSPGLRPFQNIQVLPGVGRHLKYLPSIVDYLTNWVEAMPLFSATVKEVVKVLLDSIIPQFGLVKNIDSDNGSHFTANTIKELMKALSLKWEYHTPWQPSSSGRVERMNQTLKRQLNQFLRPGYHGLSTYPLPCLGSEQPPERI
jgi:hypothetical protein